MSQLFLALGLRLVDHPAFGAHAQLHIEEAILVECVEASSYRFGRLKRAHRFIVVTLVDHFSRIVGLHLFEIACGSISAAVTLFARGKRRGSKGQSDKAFHHSKVCLRARGLKIGRQNKMGIAHRVQGGCRADPLCSLSGRL